MNNKWKNRGTGMIPVILAVLLIAAPLFVYGREPAYAALCTKKQWGKEITDAKLNKYNGKSYYWRLPGVNMYACTGYAEWALNSVYGIKTPSYPLVRHLRAYYIRNGNKIVAYGSHVAGRQGGNGKYYSYGEVKPGDVVFFFKRGKSGGKVKMKAIGASRGYLNTHGTHRWTHVAIIGGSVSGSHGINSKLHHNNMTQGIHYSGTIKQVLSVYASDKGATDYQVVRVIEPDEAKAKVKKTYTRKEWYDKEPSLAGAVFKIAGQTLKTDKNGVTPVSKPVRSGTYDLEETKAPDGFKVMVPNPKKVKLVSGKTVTFTVKDEPKQDKRPLLIVKKMTVNGTVMPEEKAVFRVWPQKYGKYSSKASWWKKIPDGLKTQVTTDKTGKAKTKDLPCASSVFTGKYYVHQIKGPGNVVLAKNKSVTLGKGTSAVKWTYNDKMNDHPSIVKKDAVTGDIVSEAGITFRMKKRGAFEKLQHYIASEELEGEKSDDVVNAFLSDDPETALSDMGIDLEDSGWEEIGGVSSFVTSSDGIADIAKVDSDDTGEYEIYETVSPSDFKLPGYRLAAVDPESASELDVPVPFVLADVASVANVTYSNMPVPEIGTRAADGESGDNGGRSIKNAEINDTVEMDNLEEGKTYTLFGTLMSKMTGKVILDRKGALASKSFTSSGMTETQVMTFRFDASLNEGEDVVVFERLYEGKYDTEPENVEPLTIHEDIEDEGQTVRFPGGHTTAEDEDTKGHTGSSVKDAVINDTFFYENLLPGNEYTVKGKLYDRKTGKPFVAGGKEVTAEETFVADNASGAVELRFTFDASELGGTTIVVGEDLIRDGKTVLTHFDLEDSDQSISYPVISTHASDASTNEHVGARKEHAVINDVVHYSNLTPGEEYTIAGYLADPKTGEMISEDGVKAAADSDSSSETAGVTKTFVAGKGEGSITLSFKISTSDFDGENVVVLEQLYYGGKEIASHLDRNNRYQTISYPSIRTKARDRLTGQDRTKAGDTTIIDTVKYANLLPGRKYELRGILMRKSTGKPVKNNNKPVKTIKSFTPGKETGEVALKFRADTTDLKGETVVVFEKLYRRDVLVASHSDLNDKAQSILVTDESSPKTGDDSMELLLLLITILIFAVVVMAIMILKYKTRK